MTILPPVPADPDTVGGGVLGGRPVLAPVGLDEPGQVVRWHRRGAVRFAVALLIMLTASAVTDALSIGVAAVLLGSAAVAFVIILLFTSTGVAGRRWTLVLWPVAT